MGIQVHVCTMFLLLFLLNAMFLNVCDVFADICDDECDILFIHDLYVPYFLVNGNTFVCMCCVYVCCVRLYPVGTTVQRYPIKDIVIQNYHIPAGVSDHCHSVEQSLLQLTSVCV